MTAGKGDWMRCGMQHIILKHQCTEMWHLLSVFFMLCSMNNISYSYEALIDPFKNKRKSHNGILCFCKTIKTNVQLVNFPTSAQSATTGSYLLTCTWRHRWFWQLLPKFGSVVVPKHKHIFIPMPVRHVAEAVVSEMLCACATMWVEEWWWYGLAVKWV